MLEKPKNKIGVERYFQNSNFYLSAFLFAKGLELVSVDKITDPRRAQFVFRDTPERMIWLEDYNFAKEDTSGAMVDVRKFVTAIKMLKDKLYQE
ncbi:MAG: DUF5659 domain-containing protein [Patescibacteria group bacterium]|jgi:hypothetical protein